MKECWPNLVKVPPLPPGSNSPLLCWLKVHLFHIIQKQLCVSFFCSRCKYFISNFRSGLFTAGQTSSSSISTSPPNVEPPSIPAVTKPTSPEIEPGVVQLRNKPGATDVKLSSSPPKIAETKPTIASDKPHIPLKPSQIREEGMYSFSYSEIRKF